MKRVILVLFTAAIVCGYIAGVAADDVAAVDPSSAVDAASVTPETTTTVESAAEKPVRRCPVTGKVLDDDNDTTTESADGAPKKKKGCPFFGLFGLSEKPSQEFIDHMKKQMELKRQREAEQARLKAEQQQQQLEGTAEVELSQIPGTDEAPLSQQGEGAATLGYEHHPGDEATTEASHEAQTEEEAAAHDHGDEQHVADNEEEAQQGELTQEGEEEPAPESVGDDEVAAQQQEEEQQGSLDETHEHFEAQHEQDAESTAEQQEAAPSESLPHDESVYSSEL